MNDVAMARTQHAWGELFPGAEGITSRSWANEAWDENRPVRRVAATAIYRW